MKTHFKLYIIFGCVWFLSCEPHKLELADNEIPPCHNSIETTSHQVDWKPSGESLYNLASTWVTQDNDSILLKEMHGKMQLIALMYTSCSYACPRIVNDLKGIDEKLTSKEKERVNIVLVSLDPERDSPEKLKSFSSQHQLDPERWTLLTGSEGNIRELSGLFNVKYKKEVNLDISHSNIISLLDVNGELIFQKEGLGMDPEETIRAIRNSL